MTTDTEFPPAVAPEISDQTVPTENESDTFGEWVPRQKFDYATYLAKPEAARGQPSGNWLASGERYEWKEEYGDVAPRDERLERELFGHPDDEPIGKGLDFSKVLQLTADIIGPHQPKAIETFEEAGLHPVMIENIKFMGYTTPTPIQKMCIPTILKGYDMISVAQTGSGKTAAFLIPILSKLMGKAKKLAAPRPPPGSQIVLGSHYCAEPLVLVVAPTRELSTQIFDESRRFCYRSMLRPCVVYGGADTYTQRIELAKGCDVLIATPGRLLDFMERGRILSLRRVKFIVIDEADEMLDMGFEPQLRRIIEDSDVNQDDDRVCMMFSATFPKSVRKLAKEFLADENLIIKIGRIGSTHSNIKQHVIYTDEANKQTALFDLLCSSPPSRTIIFAGNKRTVDRLDDFLYNARLPTTSIHGDRTQREREDALISFRSGKCPILIATAVAARGLDVKNVMHIINYDMPNNIDEYIHRIGRTARIGNHGLATTFYNEGNSEIAEDLVKILIESNQDVPDFLEQYRPEGELKFEESESEGEDNDNPVQGDGGNADDWVAPAQENGSGGDSWGVEAPPAAAGGDNWNDGGAGW
ncbi:ATP-dependent RNA helicase DED1 [Ascodesmis nigricans]|uniref:RNA helicase n=1 Tax=Ascodesmis nigricans TaxID=341454 RepID=A0A4S2MM15_9PEZI|nr:ATP-dependent RNA helicase DED1 [Ascodesmis nigricans]